MDPKLYKTEQAVFRFLDINNDGTIFYSELVDLLKNEMDNEEAQMYAGLFFEHVESDKSGFIDYTEFLRATVKTKRVCTKENILKAFNFFFS